MKMREEAEARAQFSERACRDGVKDLEKARLALCEVHQGKAYFFLQDNILHVLPVTVSTGDDFKRQQAAEVKEAAKRVATAKGLVTKKKNSMGKAAAGTHNLRALFSVRVEGGAGASVHNTSPVLVEQGPQPEGGLDTDVGSRAEDDAAQPMPLHAEMHAETLCNDAAGGAKEAGSSSRAAKKAKTAGGSSPPPLEHE
jgi:hypothetical protein